MNQEQFREALTREGRPVNPMGLSNLERETIILWNEAEKTASIYTHSPILQRQLSELCTAYPESALAVEDNRHGGLTYELPKKWVRVVSPRILSPAQREVLDRMNRNRRKENG